MSGAGFEVRELTPRGRGGVSVLRLRGPGASAALERLAGGAPAPGAPRRVRGRTAAGDALDVGLALARAPHEAELHVHGSPPLVAELVAELVRLGGRPPAERAPSVEAEARDLLAAAASEAAARMLLDQAEGALRRALERLAQDAPAAWRAGLDELAARGAVARRLVEPPCVVLAGPVNAGKSTLFNALVGRQRVVTSPEEGTTRDAIRERVLLGAYAVELVDVAGERDLAGLSGLAAVERAGQELGRRARAQADLVLWLRPPDSPAPAPSQTPPGGVAERVVVLPARGDLPGAAPGALLPGEDPLGARREVERVFHAALALPEAPWEPGAPAAFHRRWVEGLRALAPLDGPEARRAAIGELLGPPPVEPRG
ncbi:MAG: GTPase [Planctomycetota bacterium]